MNHSISSIIHTFPIHWRSLILILGCTAVIITSAAITLVEGDFQLSPTQVINVLFTPDQSLASFVVWELRIPRFFLGLLVGAALGMAGAIVQSITRNPLGSPSLMGVTSGAAFAIVVSFVLFDLATSYRLIAGSIGGFSAAALTFAIAWKTRLHPVHLTLSGMSIALFFSAGISLLLIASDGEATGLYMWLTGSLDNRTWSHVNQLYPYALVGLLLGSIYAKPLDLLMLDDDTATSLGLNILRWRLLLGLVSVILTTATVSVAGPISFVGLIAPHIVRFILLPSHSNPSGNTSNKLNHRQLLPLSALIGASLIAAADVPANLLEVPVGIFCILVGGPLFVLLIRKQEI